MTRIPDEETYLHHLVDRLGDDLASELRAYEEVLKLEADVGIRRVAQRRYLAKTSVEKTS